MARQNVKLEVNFTNAELVCARMQRIWDVIEFGAHAITTMGLGVPNGV